MGIFAFLGIIAAVFAGGLFGFGGGQQKGRTAKPPIVKQASCKAAVDEENIIRIDVDADKEYFADGTTPLYKDKEDKDWVLVKRNAVIPSWKVEGGASNCRFPNEPGREIPSSIPRREWPKYCADNGGVIVRETEKIGRVVGSGKDVYIGLGHCSGDPGATCVDPLVQDGIFVLEKAGKTWGEFEGKCKGGWRKIISSECSKLDGYWWDFSFYLKRDAFKNPDNPTYEGLPCWTKMSCAGDIIVDGGKRRREMMDEYRRSGVCPVDSSAKVNSAGINEPAAGSFSFADAVAPTGTVVKPKGKSLQLGTFYPKIKRDFAYEWWTPACKPAIYLYPEKPTPLKVRVDVEGELTKSIPEYPKGGWEVLAEPGGKLVNKAHKTNTAYNYLFYEANIKKLRVPKKGWVVAREDLGGFFEEILERLGFNNREIRDFKKYWVKKLNNAPYYFIGLLDREQLDNIEKISFSRQPDTFIRVRFVFEKIYSQNGRLGVGSENSSYDSIILYSKHQDISLQLQKYHTSHFPPPKRKGFTAVDWGGIVVGEGSCGEGLVH